MEADHQTPDVAELTSYKLPRAIRRIDRWIESWS
jgi:hypothetical protein